MQSTNECNVGTQVPAPVFGVDLQGTIADGIFSGTAPAASMSVYEFMLEASLLDLTGVVSTPSGPLAGASVSCQGFVAITDALGRFYFTDLSPGPCAVSGTASGYIITGDQVTIPVTGNGGAWAALDAVPRLSGTVKRWNTQQTALLPVPGAAVWVEPSGGGQAIASTVTDCAGNFALPVAAGIYDVHVKHPNYGEPYAFEGTDVTTGPACIAFVLAQDAMPAACQ